MPNTRMSYDSTYLFFIERTKNVKGILIFQKYLQILDRMPKADRDILLAWLDYTIKKYEYEKKTKPLLDSIRDNAPRFIETIPSNSSSTTMKK